MHSLHPHTNHDLAPMHWWKSLKCNVQSSVYWWYPSMHWTLNTPNTPHNTQSIAHTLYQVVFIFSSSLAVGKDISQHCVNQSVYIVTANFNGKIIYLLIILFLYSFDRAIQSRLTNAMCNHSSIHEYVKKISHRIPWTVMNIRVISSNTLCIIMF